jgi:signal transduction histidine kinase
VLIARVRSLIIADQLEIAWVAFAIANLCAMLALIEMDGPHGWETVPFHFIYVSFTVLYGYRMWKRNGTVAGITFVTVSSGLVTLLAIHNNREDWAELTEVPLMGLMFLAMVYHVRRRQAAVAESERLASDLRRALDRQREFVSNAQHELLTPITIARGHIDLVRHYHAPDHDEVSTACDTVIGELERMERLIDQLLLIEGAPTPGFLLPQTVDLPGFMRDLHQRWRAAAARDWQLGAVTPAAVTIDRDRMTIALDELLENAVRHTREGDRISIDAVVRGGTVSFDVADSGSGIPPAAQARVFDRFYRVDGDRNRRSGGAGLGLSLVRAVAEAHGGRVSVRGNPGGGSVFTIMLPVSVAGPQAVPAAADGLDPHAGVQLAT